MGDGGKGSAQRPIANRKTFEENWDAIFGTSSGGRSIVGNDVTDNTNDRTAPRREAGVEKSPEHKPSK